MSPLTFIEKQHFEDILGMSGGYVLSFTNETFAEFFMETVDKDIYAEEYGFRGDSKANRLRAFWEVEADPVVGEVLSGMLELWRYRNLNDGWEGDPIYHECVRIVARLRGQEEQEGEYQFLEQELVQISLEGLTMERGLLQVLEYRLSEARSCLQVGAPLAVVFLCGSVLEGMLLGVAGEHPEEFNRATCSPRDDSGQVTPFGRWSLAQLIDVACEIGYLSDDVRRFGQAVRDYRNFIHPRQQLSKGFWPDEHTARMCLQVLNAAIACLSGRRGLPMEEDVG